MITHTTLSIEINGTLKRGCLEFSLSQPVHGHHFFRAEFSGRSVEADPLSLAADSHKLAGSEIKVELSNSKGEGAIFKGIVTAVHAKSTNQAGYTQNIVFEGYSPTILLENGPACSAFTEQGLKDIVSKCSQTAHQNLLTVFLKPQHSQPLAYTVQYNESAFAFADRLARRWGEWFYYDGLELVFGTKKQPELELFYGYNLQQFDFAMQTTPAHGAFAAYGYKANESVSAKTKKSDSTIGGTASSALENAAKTWQPHQPQFLHQFNDESGLQKQIDDVAKLSIKAAAARQLTFRGTSSHPGLFPGAYVNIKTAGSNASEYGKYIITHVNHHFLEGGRYQNQFEAVPFDVEVSPLTQPALLPSCGSQPGIVTDNNDPEGMGRVKVKLFWQQDTTTPWLRISMPYTGQDKGLYFVPEIGEEVLVGFEEGNAEKPYVAGTLYHGKAKADSFKNADNDIKAIKTRGGHLLEFNDKDGAESITITDKNGNTIKLDTKAKSIEITAPEDLIITAKNITLNADAEIKVTAQQKLSIESATADVSISAGTNLEAKAAMDSTLEGGMNLNLKGTALAKLEGMMVNIN